MCAKERFGGWVRSDYRVEYACYLFLQLVLSASILNLAIYQECGTTIHKECQLSVRIENRFIVVLVITDLS